MKTSWTAWLWIGLFLGGCGASVQVESWPSMQSINYAGGEQFVEVEGRKIAFKVEGPDAGEVLFWIHPWAGNIQIWDAVITRFVAKYRVVRIDIPGHGKSDKPKIDYDIDMAARAAIGVMNHLGLHDITLIGNSLGGGTALAVMRLDGARIKRLILIDALGGGEVPGLFGFFIEQFATGPLFAGIDDGLMELFTNWFVFEQQNPHTDQLITTFLSSRAAREDGFAWSLAVSSYLRGAASYDATPWLPTIQAPTLIVWGDSDWIIWDDAAEHLRDHIPGARLVILEDCGHMPQIERPDALTDATETFLTQTP